jgi:predicted methyltransferase
MSNRKRARIVAKLLDEKNLGCGKLSARFSIAPELFSFLQPLGGFMQRTLIALGVLAALVACGKQEESTPVASEPVATPASQTPAAVVSTPPQAAQTAVDVAALLDQALAGSHRSEANKARDGFRHPKETLVFFGLQPSFTVVEITPGGGWFSEILGPVLKDGKHIAAIVDPATASNDRAREYYGKNLEDYKAKISADAANYAKTEVLTFDVKAPNFGAAGSADMVVTFRNVHNWRENKPAMFKAFFDVLKPGGVLGVEEHRANVGSDPAQASEKGYMLTADVIKLATDAGFQLAGESEINANTLDTKDHPEGVWNLPPTLAGGDKDREKYVAIGESDRMTLRFVKP